MTSSASSSVLTTLAKEGAVSCQPALRYFCANIHVSCSGRSSISAFPFEILIHGGQAEISADNQTMAGLLRDKHSFHWSSDGRYLLIKFRFNQGYLKVSESGKYSFRYYQAGSALMSQGRCE
jgi:hypothetical protein